MRYYGLIISLDCIAAGLTSLMHRFSVYVVCVQCPFV